VGPKAALSMMGALGAEGVARAISLGDARAIQSAQGVGPKLAQRVILELKSKAPSLMAQGANFSAEASADDVVIENTPAPAAPRRAPSTAAAATTARASAMADALSALTNLGYGTGDAASALASITAQTPDADTQTLIRAALKALAPKG
jgi:Holliday junction DNA helicase RuvA